jgi:hypothetical protein
MLDISDWYSASRLYSPRIFYFFAVCIERMGAFIVGGRDGQKAFNMPIIFRASVAWVAQQFYGLLYRETLSFSSGDCNRICPNLLPFLGCFLFFKLDE